MFVENIVISSKSLLEEVYLQLYDCIAFEFQEVCAKIHIVIDVIKI